MKRRRLNLKSKKGLNIFKLRHFILPKLNCSQVQLHFIKTRESVFYKVETNSTFHIFKRSPSALSVLVRSFANRTTLVKKLNVGVKTPLKTKHKCSFIIQNVGLVFPTKLSYKHISFEVYKIKKKMYSFIKRNEFKAHIFNSRKKYAL